VLITDQMQKLRRHFFIDGRTVKVNIFVVLSVAIVKASLTN
jgi:hypothetical protein